MMVQKVDAAGRPVSRDRKRWIMDDDQGTAPQNRQAINVSFIRGLLWQRTAFSMIGVHAPESLSGDSDCGRRG